MENFRHEGCKLHVRYDPISVLVGLGHYLFDLTAEGQGGVVGVPSARHDLFDLTAEGQGGVVAVPSAIMCGGRAGGNHFAL